MKNPKLSILLALGVTLFASCKKEYECDCRGTGHDVVIETVEAKSVKEAKSKCTAVITSTTGNTCIYKGVSK